MEIEENQYNFVDHQFLILTSSLLWIILILIISTIGFHLLGRLGYAKVNVVQLLNSSIFITFHHS